jgi:AcrR family transcriptional regulator
MSVTKTRSLLVDVARRLFAQQGLEGTTMNDIAVASNRGRRTLYTYFKNKEEIYYAVIETEVERLSDKMDEVVSKDMDPEQKIILMIYTHLNMIKEAVTRNGNLRAEFFRDVWKVESVRKTFDKNEINLFRRIMNEGIDKGVFDIRNVRLSAEIMHYCLKGCEVPYIYGRYAAQNAEELYPYVRNMVFKHFGRNLRIN